MCDAVQCSQTCAKCNSLHHTYAPPQAQQQQQLQQEEEPEPVGYVPMDDGMRWGSVLHEVDAMNGVASELMFMMYVASRRSNEVPPRERPEEYVSARVMPPIS
eukprot:1138478-Pelagomonas_calceolata.AAC.3